MAKVREPGGRGVPGTVTELHPPGRGWVPPLRRLLAKNNPGDEHGQLEKKNANRFAITTFSSC